MSRQPSDQCNAFVAGIGCSWQQIGRCNVKSIGTLLLQSSSTDSTVNSFGIPTPVRGARCICNGQLPFFFFFQLTTELTELTTQLNKTKTSEQPGFSYCSIQTPEIPTGWTSTRLGVHCSNCTRLPATLQDGWMPAFHVMVLAVCSLAPGLGLPIPFPRT